MVTRNIHLRFVFLFILSQLLPHPTIPPAHAQDSIIQLVHPLNNSEIISKKLTIQGRFLTPIYPESFMLLLDGMDVTGLAEIDSEGFSCALIDVLPSGEHSIYIAVQNDVGLFEQESFFSSRNYANFEELYSNNVLSGVWALTLNRSPPPAPTDSENGYLQNITPLGNASSAPYSKIDAYLSNETLLKENGFDVRLSGNLRYLNQNEEVREPEKIGLDLINFNLKADYQKNSSGIFTELGDVQINQSVNTLQNLARRGGQISFQYKDLFINTFSVLGRETFSYAEEVGLSFNPDDNIMGVSGGINFFENKIGLRALYINGSDQFNSYNSWAQDSSYSQWSQDDTYGYYSPQTGNGKGDVVGLILNSNVFSDKLYSEFEYDESDYDSDDADEYASDSDKAYRLLFGGAYDIYTYDIVYEYFGPFYNVPGARSLRKDYTGITATGYMEHEIHSLNGSLSGYHDNVDSDPYYSRVNSFYGTLGYRYYGFESVTLGFDYAKGIDRSSDEPEGDIERQLDTDILGLNLSYLKGGFSLDLYGQYSNQNDRTKEDLDTSLTTITISPVYTFESFSVFSSLSFNQSDDHHTDVQTDTYTLTLDLRGSLLQERVTYELGGTYDQTKSTDDLIDSNGISGYCRLAYYLPQSFWNRLNASVSLEANYNNREDQFGVQDGWDQFGTQDGGEQFGGLDNETHSIILSFSASLPYSL